MKIIFLLLFFLRSAFLFGQWNPDPSINTPVCTTSTTQQMFLKMIPDGNGGTFITWIEATASTAQIYVQHLSNNGTPLWGSSGVAVCPNAYIQNEPGIVSDGSGGAIVSWTDNRSGAIKHYAQRISVSGHLQWSADGIAVCSAAQLVLPNYKTVSDRKGGAILIWDDSRNLNNQIYGQRISPAGQLLWQADGLPCSPLVIPLLSYDVIADTSGGAILSWSRVTNIASAIDIYVQRITADGVVQWGLNGMNICPGPKDQLRPQLTDDGKGNFIVLWSDFRKDPVFSQIYGQRIDTNGNPYWDNDGALLLDSMSPQQSFMKLVSDSAGGGIFTWLADYVPQGNAGNIYAQRFDSTGATLWTADKIASLQGVSMPVDFLMTSDNKSGSFVAWLAPNLNPQGDGSLDVHAQHISANGTTQWANTGTVVSSAPTNQVMPQIISDTNSIAIIAWSDTRSGTSYDIYAARLNGQVNLPVEWLSFTAKQNGNSHILTWSTANENNNKGFEVERSADGYRFNRIGFVAGNGNSSSPQLYSFTEKDPLEGHNYYRLKQVDIDDKSEYSKIIRLDRSQGEKLILYPNPVSTTLRIKILNSSAVLHILNSIGEVVKTKTTSGQGVAEIDIRDLPCGVYYLKVLSNKNRNGATAKFIKQ
jgi:hypothetical protein